MAELVRLRGQPAIDLSVVGKGPLDRWQANLDLQADGRRVISGAMSIMRTDAGYRLLAKFAAALGSLVPQDYAALVSAKAASISKRCIITTAQSPSTQPGCTPKGSTSPRAACLTPTSCPQQAKFSLNLGRAGRWSFRSCLAVCRSPVSRRTPS